MNKRGFQSKLIHKVNEMEEVNGKADILRWELLYEYGRFFVDADAYCIEPVTYLIEKYKALDLVYIRVQYFFDITSNFFNFIY